MKQEIYKRITARIVEALNNGVRPWSRPWSASNTNGRITRPLRSTGEPYNGVNVILLWMSMMEKGHSNPVHVTFNQAKTLGGNVRKGEHGTTVVYADRTVKREEGGDEEKVIPFLKAYTAFNVEQVDGLPMHFYAKPPVQTFQPVERDSVADAFIAATGAAIRHGGNKCYYVPSQDVIQMVPIEAFKTPHGYYETVLHELGHWTGHDSRMGRKLTGRFGDASYAYEEIVAELTSSFVCADLGLKRDSDENHAAYIQSWIDNKALAAILTDKPRLIVSAASEASKAAEHLHSLQPQASLPAPGVA